MQLALTMGYSGAEMRINMEPILEAERLGFESVWTAEAYGSDAISPLAWAGALTKKIKLGTAIMQMPARTPAMTAMTAMTLDAISGGRFKLGIGPSGPQVVEGWHGMPYGKPLTRTREYITIIRKILAREAPLEHHGVEYNIPYTGAGASGLGKPLKSILHGRNGLPIYMASISPRGIELSGEIADGLLLVWMNPDKQELFVPFLEQGFKKAGGGKSIADFDLASSVVCNIGSDVEKCRMPVKGMLALYIGGMGARGKNFYNDYCKRLGYEEVAVKVQDLYLTGKKAEAMAAIPDKMVDEVALVGPKERVRDRLKAWKKSAVRTIHVASGNLDTLRTLAELAL